MPTTSQLKTQEEEPAAVELGHVLAAQQLLQMTRKKKRMEAKEESLVVVLEGLPLCCRPTSRATMAALDGSHQEPEITV